MSIIAIEEHWNSPDIATALDALPDAERDESVAFNEMRDHPERLADIGDQRIAGMDAQGIEMQIL